MIQNLNTSFIKALVKRDLTRYFSNPTGYVFITLFIFLSAAAAFWQDRFFLNNLANLGELNNLFPFILTFFIPALTMSVWSEERKQGTDEILLTLPATSLEVVLGKFISTVGIFTASLILSLSHALVLFWLGSPDIGLLFSNYLGYWLLGSALIAAGLLASQLTVNAAVSFILGAVFCSILLFIDSLAGTFSEGLGNMFVSLSAREYFSDLARGVVSLRALLYFSSVTAILLHINVLIVDRRHWPNRLEGRPTWAHYLVRAIAIVIAVLSLNVIIGRASLRLDVTAEQLHSLSSETKRLINELQDDRPVFVQAFISPEVPELYVQTREDLLSILNEIDAIGGSKVQVLIEDTEPFSTQARDAREKFGIVPRETPVLGSARTSVAEVFLGVAFTCGAEEQVIPFLDRGLSAEYEIARSIRVVARTDRKKLGVYQTELRMFGGLDFQTMRSTPAWSVVEELKKQYEVVQISPGTEIPEDLDGLLVPLPSTLPQAGMDALLPVIKDGLPTLLVVDPLPIVNIGLAPSEQPGDNQNPFMRNQAPPPQPKGDIQGFLAELGFSWDSGRIIWDSYNPHPDLAQLPPEVVFVGQGNGNQEAFNLNNVATSKLQEVVLLYPGAVDKAVDSKNEFVPLLKSGVSSGRFNYFQMVQRSFFGTQLNPSLPHRPDDYEYTLAAHVKGIGTSSPSDNSDDQADSSNEDTGSDAESESEDSSSSEEGARNFGNGLNVIAIADLDFISEQFFQIRARGPQNLNFDNVTFFLNCIDVLMGDESFVALRNKRVKHRTLERVEAQTKEFIDRRVNDEQDAEAEADRALNEAQQRLDEKVAEVQERPDLDAQTKQIMARNLQESENRKFEVLKANIETEKQAKIHASMENMEEQIRNIQSGIRTFAVLLPPIPVFILGVWIFIRRQRREKEGAAAARRLRA
jgi:ABC-2 type transport system permease protein